MTALNDLIPSSQLRKMLSGVSQMTVWRWLRLTDDPLPAPAAILGGRRFWDQNEINDWIARRSPAWDAAALRRAFPDAHKNV